MPSCWRRSPSGRGRWPTAEAPRASAPDGKRAARPGPAEGRRVLDLLITGGQIVDGSGNVGFGGAIGIDGETLRVLRGDVSDVQAARTIDARGKVVCPGFIDFHSHGGLVMLAEPRHEPKVRQGITTEVIGVDGNSYAPFRDPADLQRFIDLNSGLDGRPPLTQRWSTVAEYLALFDQKVAVNICYL